MWYLIQAIIDLCRSLNWVCDWTVYMLWIWEDLVKWLYSASQELLHHYCWSQDSTVSVVSRPRAGHTRNLGLIPGRCKRLIASQKLPDLLWGPPSVLLKTSRSSLGPTQCPIQWGTWGAVSLAIRKLWREADHSPSLLPRLRMSGGLPPLPYMPLCTYGNNSAFYCTVMHF